MSGFTASAAPAAPAPAPSAADFAVEAPASAAPASAAPADLATLPDPFADPEGFDAYYEGLSDEDRQRLEADALADSDDPAAADDPAAPPAEPAPAASAAPVDESAPLSPEEFASLPPRVQKLIEENEKYLDELSQRYESLGEVATPEFRAELDRLLDHPAVQAARRELATGNPIAIPAELGQIAAKDFITPEDIASLEGAYPQEVAAKVEAIVSKAIESAVAKTAQLAEYQATQKAQIQANADFYNAQIDQLVAAHKLPKDKPVTDAAHPLNPFIKDLQAAIRAGDITHGYARRVGLEGLYAAFLTRSGGIQGIASQAARAERVRMLERIEAARKTPAAPTVGATTQTQRSGMEERWGVNPQRLLEDETYALSKLDELEDNAEARHELEYFSKHGEWPRKQARR